MGEGAKQERDALLSCAVSARDQIKQLREACVVHREMAMLVYLIEIVQAEAEAVVREAQSKLI